MWMFLSWINVAKQCFFIVSKMKRVLFHVQSFHMTPKRNSADSQNGRCCFDLPVWRAKGFFNSATFKQFRVKRIFVIGMGFLMDFICLWIEPGGPLLYGLRQVRKFYGPMWIGNGQDRLYQMFQLPYVSGKVIRGKGLHGFWWKWRWGTPVLFLKDRTEMFDKNGEVFGSFPEGRNLEGESIQAIEKVRSHPSFPKKLFRVLVCCGNDPCRDGLGLVRTHGLKAAIFQKSQ